MPSKKPMTAFILEDELLQRIEKFRFDNRITTRSEAIRRLIEEGLKKSETAPKRATRKPPLPQ